MRKDSFSLEWELHYKTQYDSETKTRFTEESLRGRAGLDPEEFWGRLVLDAGCGSGRYLEVVRRHGGMGVGCDSSRSVFAARKSLPEDVGLVQADLFCLPFREESFDKVLSLGVLHHTPDPRRAFSSLATLVKPGGELAVSVYSNEGLARRYTNALGSISRRLASVVSLRTLYRLCQSLAGIPLPKALLVHPYLRPSDLKFSPTLVLNFFLPFLSTVEDKDWRALDTFDYLSPEFQSKHTYSEVAGWFRKSGLRDISALEIPVSVKGKKPVRI